MHDRVDWHDRKNGFDTASPEPVPKAVQVPVPLFSELTSDLPPPARVLDSIVLSRQQKMLSK